MREEPVDAEVLRVQPSPLPRKSKSVARVLGLFAAVIWVFVVIGFLIPHLYYDKDTAPSAAKIKLRKSQFLPVSQYEQLYKSNEIKADELVKGKWFAVTGIVTSVSSDILGSLYVDLVDESSISAQCFFDDRHKAALAELIQGQRVFIGGTCRGKVLGNILFLDCQLLEPID